MTLQSNGKISLGDVRTEINTDPTQSIGTGQIALNSPKVKTLARYDIYGYDRMRLSYLYSQKAAQPLATPVLSYTGGDRQFTVSWSAVPNAGSYHLVINGENQGYVVGTTYTTPQNKEPSLGYAVYVSAAPSDIVNYREGEAASIMAYPSARTQTPTVTVTRAKHNLTFTIMNNNASTRDISYKLDNSAYTKVAVAGNDTKFVSTATTSGQVVTLTAYAELTGTSRSLDAVLAATSLIDLAVPTISATGGVSSVTFAIYNPNPVSAQVNLYIDNVFVEAFPLAAYTSINRPRTVGNSVTLSGKAYLARIDTNYANSEYSAAVSATSYPAAPSTPATPGVTVLSTTQVQITFTVLAGLTYTLYRNGQAIVNNPVFPYTDNVWGGTNFYYAVEATNIAGSAMSANSTTVLTYPVAPSSVTLDSATSTTFNVTIDPVPTASAYRVEYATSGSSTYTLYGNSLPATFTFTGAVAETLYVLRVRAYNGGDGNRYSDWTASNSLVTLKTPPAAPTPTYTKTAYSITLNLSSSVNGNYYEVILNGTSQGNLVGNGAALSWDYPYASPATSYTLRVRAWNNGGEAYSSITTIVTLPIKAVASADLIGHDIRLTWTSQGVATTKFYLAGTLLTDDMTPYTQESNYGWFLHPWTIYNSKHSFTVKTFNSVGDFVSDTLEITTPAKDPAKPIVTLSQPTDLMFSQITVSWTNVQTAETGAVLYAVRDGGSTYYFKGNRVDDVEAKDLTVTSIVIKAEKNKSSDVVVEAVGVSTQVIASDSKTYKMPLKCNTVSTDGISTTQLSLVWESVPPANQYEIKKNGTSLSSGNVGSWPCSKTMDGLTAGSQYTFSVRPIVTEDTSWVTYANTVTQWTDPLTPTISSTSKSSGGITINWTALSGVQYYNIHADGGLVGTSNSASFYHSGSDMGHQYQVSAVGYNTRETSWSGSVYVNNYAPPTPSVNMYWSETRLIMDWGNSGYSHSLEVYQISPVNRLVYTTHSSLNPQIVLSDHFGSFWYPVWSGNSYLVRTKAYDPLTNLYSTNYAENSFSVS